MGISLSASHCELPLDQPDRGISSYLTSSASFSHHPIMLLRAMRPCGGGGELARYRKCPNRPFPIGFLCLPVADRSGVSKNKKTSPTTSLLDQALVPLHRHPRNNGVMLQSTPDSSYDCRPVAVMLGYKEVTRPSSHPPSSSLR